MKPIDFFKTADLLKTHTEEAHLRTSIGRSYYAAFLYFRERLKTLGLEKKKKPNLDAHAFVVECLGFSRVSEGSKASQYLKGLKQNREDADYHLDKKLSQNDAEDALARARKLIDDYKANITPTKETKLVESASSYARSKDWL